MRIHEQEPEIVAGDARLRKRTLVLAALALLAGVLLLWALSAVVRDIQDLADRDLPAAASRMARLVGVIAGTTGLCLVTIAGWFWLLARRIKVAGRFPPPGMNVIKDTAVRTGGSVRTMARIAQVAAAVFLLAGTVGMWAVYRVAVSVLQGK